MPRSMPAGLPYMIMPKDYAKHVIIAPWSDIEAIKKIMRIHGNDIAGIILEPVPMNMGVIPADHEFIKLLRDLANEYNSLLIFDDVKTCTMWYRGASSTTVLNRILWLLVRAVSVFIITRLVYMLWCGNPLSAVRYAEALKTREPITHR